MDKEKKKKKKKKKKTTTTTKKSNNPSNKETSEEIHELWDLPRASGRITKVNFFRRTVRDAGVVRLCAVVEEGRLRNVIVLDIAACEVTAAGMERLAAAMASGKLSKLQRLNVRENDLGDESVARLCEVIEAGHLPTLEWLCLAKVNLTPAGMERLAAAMASGKLSKLKHLDVGKNELGDEGMAWLCEAVTEGRLHGLEWLWLGGTNLTDTGMGRLAAAMASGKLSKLKELSVSKNSLGVEGARALCAILPALPHLSKLYIFGNSVSHNGGRRLLRTAAALQPSLSIHLADSNTKLAPLRLPSTAPPSQLLAAASLPQRMRFFSLFAACASTSALEELLVNPPDLSALPLSRARPDQADPAAPSASSAAAPGGRLALQAERAGLHQQAEASLPHFAATRAAQDPLDAAALLNSELHDLRDLLAEVTAPDSQLPKLRQHAVPAFKHINDLPQTLSTTDAVVQAARNSHRCADSRLPAALERSERTLVEHTDAALAKAEEARLSPEECTQLRVAREERLKALAAADGALSEQTEHVSKLQEVHAQLEALQHSLCDALQSPPRHVDSVTEDASPPGVDELQALEASAAKFQRRATALEHLARSQAQELSSTLEELQSLSDELMTHVVSTLHLAPDADFSVDVPKALQDCVLVRLREAHRLQDELAEPEETTRQRVAELRQAQQAIEADLDDVANLPVLEERLVQACHEMEDQVDEMDELQSKLRRLIRRNRLTPAEKAKREAAIAAQQRQVAESRAKLEKLQHEVETLAGYGLPEAVQLLACQRNDAHVPEVLRMLQPTGLYRNRDLNTDYEQVSGVDLASARYQLRVVQPVGGDSGVKVLKAYPADLFKRIRNEVVNVARVEHPNVLRPELVFMEPTGSFVWIQYPYLARGSLDRWLASECVGRFELLSQDGHETLRGVFRELLDGVAHLHTSGVVHNDLKPQNVLMGDDGVPCICDFELSTQKNIVDTRALGSMTVGGLTVSYAAPEVRMNQRSTTKSDMYSLGRLMYDTQLHEWLAAEHHGAAAAAAPDSVFPPGFDPRARTWAFPDDVHPAFRDLVTQLLAEEPDARPSAELARAHPFFTQVLFPEEEVVPHSLQLDLLNALPERQYWSGDGSDPTTRCVQLDLRGPEAVAVGTRFRAQGCARRRVVSIQRVENGELLRRFAFHKHLLWDKYGAAVEERLVFHGTKPGVVLHIVEQGFDMRLNGVNGTAYGKGNYFARDSSYSTGNTYSPPDVQGVKWMFVARILVGETVRGNRQMRRAERPDGTLVDTAVNNVRNPNIFVTFDNAQAVPVYLIGFK